MQTGTTTRDAQDGDVASLPIGRIRADAPVYPSEDPAKVEDAINNVFDGVVRRQKFSITSDATEMSSLGHVREAIRTGAESKKAYRRSLEENQHGDDTWFYLNKQAAFAGRVAICREADESPLGPIKITFPATGQILDWLLPPPPPPLQTPSTPPPPPPRQLACW